MKELVPQNKKQQQKSAVAKAGTNIFTVIPAIGGITCLFFTFYIGHFLFIVGSITLLSLAFALFIGLTLFYKVGSVVSSKKQFLTEKYEKHKLQSKLKDAGDFRAAKQFKHLEECYKNFTQRLDDRIGKESSEYLQYLAPADDLYEAAIRNLKAMKNLYDDISVARVSDSEKELQRLIDSGDATIDDLKMFKRKRRIAEDAEDRIEDLRKEVDNAITVLIEVANQLNDIITNRDEVQKGMNAAIAKFQKAADLNRRINDKVKKAWEMLA